MGVHRSTYYRWTRAGRALGGWRCSAPARAPASAHAQPVLARSVEQRIVALLRSGIRGSGPKRIASRLARPQWGGLIVSPNGVYKTLVRHGLNTRARRLALVAGYRAPYEPPREPAPEPHIHDHPAGRAGRDRLLSSSAGCMAPKGPVWQITAIDHLQLLRAGPNSSSPAPKGRREQTSTARHRVAADLQAAGWRLERMLSATTAPSSAAHAFSRATARGIRHTRIRSGRPQTNGHVERLHAHDPRRVLATRVRALPARPRSAACAATSLTTCTTTTTPANTTDASPTADAPPTSSTVPARWSRHEPHRRQLEIRTPGQDPSKKAAPPGPASSPPSRS